MPSAFIDFCNIRYHFCSANVIGSKPVFVTTVTAADDARSATSALAASRSLASEAAPAMGKIILTAPRPA